MYFTSMLIFPQDYFMIHFLYLLNFPMVYFMTYFISSLIFPAGLVYDIGCYISGEFSNIFCSHIYSQYLFITFEVIFPAEIRKFRPCPS